LGPKKPYLNREDLEKKLFEADHPQNFMNISELESKQNSAKKKPL